MLAELLTTALAVILALAWIAVCLLPLLMAWGLWLWLKNPSSAHTARQQAEIDALIAECDALQAQSRALQAGR